jgi:5S rRNA maturation endonuclease (ribonuclease M5)
MTTYLNSLDLKQELIEKALTDLGYQLADHGKYWRCSALYRNGDNRTALQIWKDTGIWKDFVANTTYQPFKRLLELSCKDDSKIEQFLQSITNNEESWIESSRTPKMETDQFFDHDEVKTLLPHYDFYNNKGISSETLQLYKAGFSMSGRMNGRFVFPIFDENGKVIGISGRHLLWNSNSNFPKWKHIGKKSNWIYPINLQLVNNIFKKTIEEKNEIILVEGIGDSLALSQQGYYNHLVVFGLEISSKQLSFLMSLSLNKIIISTNNDFNKSDNRGLQAAIKMFLKLIKYIDIDKVHIKLPVLKDFGEMLEKKIDINKWENKRKDRIAALEYILDYVYNNTKDSKAVSIITDNIEKLKFERDSISQ